MQFNIKSYNNQLRVLRQDTPVVKSDLHTRYILFLFILILTVCLYTPYVNTVIRL